MPPQPLLKICPDAGISFTPESVIERPEVAAWIGQCIACWSWVETQTSRLFTHLLDLNVEDGVELYNSFGGASLKENGIKILARSKLPRRSFEIIEALLKVINSHQKTRDKISHWYWGISDQIRDGLVLIDPKQILIRDARIRDMRANGKRPAASDYRYPPELIRVYRVQDLQVDAKSFIELAQLVNKCARLCFKMESQQLSQLHDELSNDGRLAARLNPSSSEDQCNHQVPPAPR
jgi:hypothetical protein